MRAIWCVWSESGEYEQFSRDLRGLFATRELAESHADQLRQTETYLSLVEVMEQEVLSELPVRVPFVRFAAHILPGGVEDMSLGYHRGAEFQTWSHELRPLDRARTDPWSNRGEDLYIEVVGSDEGLVSGEYSGRLNDLRTAGGFRE